MRLLTAAATLAIVLSSLTLSHAARADGEQFGPPNGWTRAQIAQHLSEQNAKWAKHTSVPAPMAKQISSNLNNDGAEAYTKQPPRQIVRNAFGRTIDNRAATQKMYNPNDDSVVPQNRFVRRPFAHRMFGGRPGTPVTAGSNLNN